MSSAKAHEAAVPMSRALAWAPLVFLAVVFLYPLARILALSLAWESPAGPLAPFRHILGDPYYLGRLWFTTWQAALSTALVLAVGLPSAYLFARYRFPGRSLLLALSTVAFMMPPIVMALGFIALLGPTGLVNRALMALLGLSEPPVRLLHTLGLILIAHIVYEYTIVVRLVSTFWSNMDPRLGEAARSLGASPFRTFLRVTLPLLAPAIAAAAALVFLFTFTSFGVVLILGGAQYATLEVAVYTLAAKLFRLPLAAALALVQMGVILLVLLAYARLQEMASARVPLAPRAEAPLRSAHGGARLLVVAAVLGAALVVSPLVALLARSLWGPEGFTLAGYAAVASNEHDSFLFISPLRAVRNSLGFAAGTVLLALPLGLAAAYALRRRDLRGRWWRSPLDAFYMLPLGVPSVTLGFGFLVGFRLGPVDLRATWVPILMAHVLVAYPFVLRVLFSTLRSMEPQLREAARALGAGPARVLRHVELPILARPLLVGAVFAFAISLGEFGATLVLNRPEYTTMPIAIFRYLGQPGARHLAEALAMSSLLMLVAAVGFLAIERARYRGWGEF